MVRRATKGALKQQVFGTGLGSESAVSETEQLEAKIHLHRSEWKGQQFRTLQIEKESCKISEGKQR